MQAIKMLINSSARNIKKPLIKQQLSRNKKNTAQNMKANLINEL